LSVLVKKSDEITKNTNLGCNYLNFEGINHIKAAIRVAVTDYDLKQAAHTQVTTRRVQSATAVRLHQLLRQAINSMNEIYKNTEAIENTFAKFLILICK
jgi:hypothetical protein